MPPVFLEQWCYADRVGGDYVIVNSFNKLPMPDEPPTVFSHHIIRHRTSWDITRKCKILLYFLKKFSILFFSIRRYQFMDGLPEAIEKLDKYKAELELAKAPPKWKR